MILFLRQKYVNFLNIAVLVSLKVKLIGYEISGLGFGVGFIAADC